MGRAIETMVAALVAGALALPGAACHDLPDLGTCGNGVIEAALGEACDEGRETPTCTATCELKCAASAVTPAYVDVGGGAFCPDARFRCGQDQICRAPSGRFALPAPAQPFDVTSSPVLADVDNDGLPDLVGTSPTNIYIRFSSAQEAPLDDLVVQAAPSSDAPYAIFDLQPGVTPAEPDIVIAVPTEGVALLKSDGASFVPQLDLSIPVMGEVQGHVLRDPDPSIGDAVHVVVRKTPSTFVVTRLPIGPPGQPPIVPVLELTACTGVAAGPWKIVDVVTAPDRRSFVLVTQRDLSPQSAQPWHVCRYTHNGAGPGASWSLADFELAAPTPSSVVLANVDGDACQELVLHSDATNGALTMIDATGASCALAGAPLAVPFAGPGGGLLAAGQVIPGQLDELVLSTGVFRACVVGVDCGASPAGTFVRAAVPTTAFLAWSGAAVVDLNRDGALDVVAARAPDADVDIVRGGGALNVYRADTAQRISSLVAGDFDGDRLGDVAMVESSAAGDRISVLFGTQESIVGAPRAMSAFGGKLQIDRVSENRWFPSARSSDGLDDLVVLDSDPSRGVPAAGMVVGDAARLMTTPRLPPTATGTPLGAVAAGAFGSPDVEVLAIANNQLQLFNVMANAWAPSLPIGNSLTQPVAALRAGAGKTLGAARVDITGGSSRDVAVFGVRGAFTMCKATVSDVPADLRGVDVDGDGVDELAVITGTGGAPRKIQLFGAACPLTPLLTGVLDDCVDVANTGERLIALCRVGAGGERSLFQITKDGGGFVRAAAPFVELGGGGRFLTAGDFDGDGVPDLAIGVDRGGTVNVQLLRQCPAHDTRGCPL